MAPQSNLIGPAGRLLDSLAQSLAKQDKIKLLLYGPPGVGKTSLAEQLAAKVCGKWDIESVNGRNLTIHVVREWGQNMASSSLFGDWRCKIVNEVDTMPRDAQDALLSLLDEMPAKRAFIATSNLDLDLITERLRTRMLRRKIDAPSAPEILRYLRDKGVPAAVAMQIAETACGNVRAAELDAQAWRNEQPEQKTSAPINMEMLSMLATL